MKVVHKINKGQTMQPAIAIGIGVGVCIGVSTLLSAIAALMIYNENLPHDGVGALSVFVHLIASLFGCLTAKILSGRMPAIVSAITCGVYFLLLIACNILFMEGQFSGVGGGFLSIIGGGLIAILPSFITKKERGHKKRRFG